MKLLSLVMAALLALVSVSVAEELVIVGTGSGSSILRALGQAYTEQNPGITITIPASIGSGGGIKAVGQDEFIMGRIAREIAEKEKRYNLTSLPFARMPIVIFVNSGVSLREITSEQVCMIYDGITRKWEELGGGKGKIRVIRREDGDSSLRILLKTLPGFKDITLTNRAKITYSDPDTVAEAEKQSNAIAFGTLPNTMHKNGVRALKLDGWHPTDPQYPCVGTLSLIYKGRNISGIPKSFIEFLSTPAAKKAIIGAGGLPLESFDEH